MTTPNFEKSANSIWHNPYFDYLKDSGFWSSIDASDLPQAQDTFLHEFPDWIAPISSLEELEEAEIIVIATAHDEFIDLDWRLAGEKIPNKIVFDGRRVLKPDTMTRAGWRYLAVGYPAGEGKK